jgi:lipopolysaccharide export system protein LptA
MINRMKILAFMIASIAPLPASAQLAAKSNEPIDITGDAAEFQENIAVWSGNVRVLQGEAILTTDRLEADLSKEGDFDKIRAIGSVRYSNGAEAITGEKALFDNVARTITITENVIVTQGKQVISAGAVIYWVDTGKVKFLPEPGKRIRGIFYTNSEDGQT